MNWIKTHYKSVITYVILYVIAMVFFAYPMSYEVYLPGGVNSAEEFVTFENPYPSSGSFNSSYVSVVTKTSPFQYMLGKFNKKAEIRKMGKVESKTPIKELNKISHLHKLNSIYTSLIVAYDRAGKDIKYTENGIVIINRIVDTPSYESLEVGDIIIKINNTEVHNYEEVSNILSDFDCYEPFYLTVIRDEKEITFDIEKEKRENQCILGIYKDYTYTNYEFKPEESSPPFDLIDTSGFGPSAGFIQTLSIYNMLTPIDITFGLKIAGTGTINLAGEVGIIGGVEQKVFGACKADVDIFFAPDYDYNTKEGPRNNYKDALKARDIMKSDMIIVPVKTLDDAINYLLEHYG